MGVDETWKKSPILEGNHILHFTSGTNLRDRPGFVGNHSDVGFEIAGVINQLRQPCFWIRTGQDNLAQGQEGGLAPALDPGFFAESHSLLV